MIALTKGYWQTPLSKSKAKTAFSTLSGLYQNALRVTWSGNLIPETDGPRPKGGGEVRHQADLRRVLASLQAAGLTTNQKKSHLGWTAVQNLGFNIGGA